MCYSQGHVKGVKLAHLQKQVVLGECEVSTGCSMREYEQQTIEEVVASAKHGNDEAMEYVLAKYKGLVRGLSRTLFLLDGDEDDLIQEGMIGLYKAVVSYDECRGAAFASHCINRQMYSAVKKSNRKKNGPLNTYISIDSASDSDNEQGPDSVKLLDRVSAGLHQNPEDIIIDREEAGDIEERLFSVLSGMEREVLSLFLRGMTYQEIARYMQKQPKAIDNALQRIKTKLRTILR